MNWPRCGLVAVLCATAAAQSVPEAQEFDNRGSAAAQGYQHMDAGYVLAGQGKRREAIEEYKQALALHRQVLGATHLRTLTNMNLLASARLMSGDMDGAEPLLKEIIA